MKKDMSIIYKPVYDTENVDYFRKVSKGGEEIEMIYFFMSDKHMVTNPPDYTKTIDKLIKLLKGTGISRITITFLNKNLLKE